LTLTVSRPGTGPVTGAAPLVAIRHAGLGQYLDWQDGTFKAAGWGVRQTSLPEVDASLAPGRYARGLDLGSVTGAVAGTVLVAEYSATVDGVLNVATESWLVTGIDWEVARVRKWFTNRLEEAAGNPGTLVLFDDDDTTPMLTWTLRDGLGGPTVFVPGRPARRSKGV
jgi:hypothetical protein